MCKPIGYLFSFVLSHMIFIMAVVFVSCTKNNTETDEPQKTVEGKYIGIRNYIYEGKNPIDGAFYNDTSYTDTIDVLLIKDSIQFYNGNSYNQYLRNDSDYYTGYRSYYKIKADTLFDQSSFYSGTDADHYVSSTNKFKGVIVR